MLFFFFFTAALSQGTEMTRGSGVIYIRMDSHKQNSSLGFH